MNDRVDSIPGGPHVQGSDLVRRAQAGDRAAFKRLYEDHVGRVYALCLRLTGDSEDAMERTQDVFVRAWGKLGSFRGEAAFATWLHRLAVNVVLTDRRATGRRDRRTDAAAVMGPRSEPAPRAGLAVDLERAIAALPPGARAVFVLYDVEGYRHEEIAEMTGIAAGTSKAQLHRARKLLREALA
ncbi:MAG TPA: sigma-70 family RNA polymerase sigma factor [Gemmatimonadota bacterium]|nr:sigma-70 family RNA polymerase sigma factor [Gemmatimonadota bacterium]